MSNQDQQSPCGVKVGEILIEDEILILDFYNKQYRLAMSFMDEVVEHAEVTIDKGKYR